jgi:hypothetical protein
MVELANEWRKGEGGPGYHPSAEWRDALMNVAGLGSSVSNLRLGRWLARVKDRPMVFNNTGEAVTVKIVQSTKVDGYQQWMLGKVEAKQENLG